MKSVLLQAPQNAMIGQFVLLGAIMVVFYFFMIRPQQKKQKDQKKYREGIKAGDDVVTVGGIYGKVVQVTEDTVVLDVDRGVKITFTKDAISLESSQKAAKKA
jgi:preprotein translocase subunit YajC